MASNGLVSAQNGKSIYQNKCAECHGEKGEGVEGIYESKLRGVLTLYELESYISQTMPEGDEDACTGPDAKAVAQFVYDQFYSLEAQNRLDPPKYVFSRLTNEQYRNSVTDILGRFLNRREDQPREFGLKGTYYASRSMRKNKQVNERIDPVINFDFGEGSPDKVEGKEFSIRWTGALIAAETGEYEIMVESANSVRLRLNSSRKPLVDANVVSGNRAEYKAKVTLTGGRLYSLSIDVSRFKEKNGFVRISWLRPNGVEEIIPQTNFCTNRIAPLPLLTTRFPADDESYGYARGISVSKQWTSSLSKASVEAGQLVVRYFDRFVKPDKDPQKRIVSAKRFCEQIAEQAFRHPLTPSLRKLYIDRQFSGADGDIREATKRSVALIFKSPRFLYVDLDPTGTEQSSVDPPAYIMARVLWDSVPSAELLKAQNNKKLVDNKSIDWLIDRMLADQRARIKIHHFFEHFLKVNGLHGLEKDKELFQAFDSDLTESLKRSLMLQIEHMVWKDNASLTELLQTRKLLADERMSKFYGLSIPEKAERVAGFAVVDRKNASGLLSHPLLMSGFAYTSSSSPIHRGVFLAQNILGRRMNPPPDTFPPFDGEVAKTWTTREKVSFQTKPISCQRCHGLINSLGFAFESYDAVGRARSKDNEKNVDTSGQYRTDDGKLVKFNSPQELVKLLAGSNDVHRHFVNELFQFLVKQPLSVYGDEATARLHDHFRKSNYNIKSLIREIGKVAAFYPPNR